VSSVLHVQRPDRLAGIAVVPVVQRPNTRVPSDIWHDLIHEMATVRALTAAALGATSEATRVAMLTLIESETAEVSGLIGQLRRDYEAAEPAEVSSVLSELVRMVAPTTTTRLVLRLGDVSTLRVGIDRVSLRRVLRNLLENAIRAAGPDGTVELSADHSDSGLRLSIADSGPGFGFGPPGLGSRGLAIVSTLVEAAGGDLAVGSCPDLGGALVTVSFPVAHLN
jgi:signal transduction histidine kinase